MHICGTSTFKLIQPKGVPTFYPPRRNGKGITIDLVWANFTLSKRIHRCEILSDTFGSDHQVIATVLYLSPPNPLPLFNSASLIKLDTFSFLTGIERAFEVELDAPCTPQEVDEQVNKITTTIVDTLH